MATAIRTSPKAIEHFAKLAQKSLTPGEWEIKYLESMRHVMEHKTKIRLVFTDWKIKICVRCDCSVHHLHLHFPLYRWRGALELWRKW